jgi:mono/diheme cytochrome c family protein
MVDFRNKYKGVFLVLSALLLSGAAAMLTQSTGNAYGSDTDMGKKVYQKYCVICHGAKGDGKGLVGIIHRFGKKGLVWSVYPRDFTAGVYKFRTTPTGCLPDDKDLMMITTQGIPRSGMPSHEDVSVENRRAVIEYLKTLSPRRRFSHER